MSSDLTSNEIIIPINDSTNANKNFEEKNLIQKKSFLKIEHLVEKNLGILKNGMYTVDDRFHEAITILGSRGSGKTSFLLNLENTLSESVSNDLSFLKILDPTLFESKQHVMLTIISIIINKVDRLKKKKKVDETLLDKYKSSLNSLADGINLLDGIDSEVSHKSVWEDSRINFNKGIASSKSGISFEEDFKEFLEITLKYIKKEMFVLVFDDIDTNIEKGWPVLEVIRKYLTSLRLQVIVSGDWNLFSTLVKVKQFKNLNGIEKVEDENLYLNTLEILEEQYLTKILKPENRIMLQGLDSISKNTKVYIVKDKKSSAKSVLNDEDLLENIYKNIISKLLKTNKKDTYDNYIKLFLTLPLRSNIQLMFTYFKSEEDNTQLNEEFVDEVGKQFLTQLSKFRITFKDFWEFKEDSAVYFYIRKFIELTVDNKELDINTFFNIANLRPIEDQNKNIVFFIFKSFLSLLVNKRIDIALEWMFKIELYKLIRSADKEFYRFNPPLQSRIVKTKENLSYLGHGVYTNSYEYAIRLNGFLNYQELEKKDTRLDYIPGFIKVYKDKSKKGKDSYQYFIDEVKKLNDKDSFLILSYLMFTGVNTKKSSQSDLYGSIYLILGFIAELIKGKYLGNSVKDTLKKQIFGVIRPYSDNNIHDMIDVSYFFANGIEDCTLISSLEDWLKQVKVTPFPLETLSSTMDNFFYQENKMGIADNFGDYIKAQIFYFLNALLIAEVQNIKTENMNSTVVKRISTIDTAYERFDQSITKYKDLINFDAEEQSIFSFMYKCPIWEYLIGLHSNSTIYKATEVKKIIKQDMNNPDSLFAELFSNESDGQQEYEIAQNKYFELLEKLKSHQIKEDTKENDEGINNIVDEESKNDEDNIDNEKQQEPLHNRETYLKLLLDEKEKLKNYIINANESLSFKRLQPYKNVIKKHYKTEFRFSGEKEKILEEVVLEFSALVSQDV